MCVELDQLSGASPLVKAAVYHPQCHKTAETKQRPKGTKIMLLLDVWPLYLKAFWKGQAGQLNDNPGDAGDAFCSEKAAHEQGPCFQSVSQHRKRVYNPTLPAGTFQLQRRCSVDIYLT